jgi:hypothetical protein
MTHAVPYPVRRDAEPAATDDQASLNMFHVMAINLFCFLAMTVAAVLLGITWWVAVLLGWAGSRVATLPVTALVVLLWPVASEEPASRAAEARVADIDETPHVAMWHRDLAEDADAARVAATPADAHARDARGRKASGVFTMAVDLSAERRAI